MDVATAASYVSAAAWIQSLAQELPYAVHVAIKKKNQGKMNLKIHLRQ